MIQLLDTHQHLVYRNEANYGWTKDIPPLATEDFTVDDYLKLTEGLGIGGTLFMETGVDDPDYQKEAHYIKTLADNNAKGIKGLILSTAPEDNDSFDQWLEEYNKERISIGEEPEDAFFFSVLEVPTTLFVESKKPSKWNGLEKASDPCTFEFV